MIEDTRLQAACARLLTVSDAPAVRACGEGYRPGRGAGDAGRDLSVDRPYGRYGSVGEADRQGLFEHREHAWRLTRLRVRIDARAWRGLIRTWRNAGLRETDGRVIHPDIGGPQGGGLSPV